MPQHPCRSRMYTVITVSIHSIREGIVWYAKYQLYSLRNSLRKPCWPFPCPCPQAGMATWSLSPIKHALLSISLSSWWRQNGSIHLSLLLYSFFTQNVSLITKSSPTQGSNLCLLHLLNWQADSLPWPTWEPPKLLLSHNCSFLISGDVPPLTPSARHQEVAHNCHL